MGHVQSWLSVHPDREKHGKARLSMDGQWQHGACLSPGLACSVHNCH